MNTKDRVLFLCTGNYYRSRFAEELFNFFAKGEGIAWRAFSRGLAERGSPENVGPISQFALELFKHEPLCPKERHVTRSLALWPILIVLRSSSR